MILDQRPAWIARRAGAPAGFAFGHRDEFTGQIGALDPSDMPALLAHVENEAAGERATKLYFSTPLMNDTAVQYLLSRGYTIDPFFMSMLVETDRWIHLGLSYIV